MKKTKEQWIKEAHHLLKLGLEDLKETGGCPMLVMLVTDNDAIELYQAEGEATNSSRAKEAMSRQLRARIAKSEIAGVLHLSDMWWAHIDENDPQTGEKARLIRELDLSVSEAHERGLCEKREALRVALETRDGFQYQIIQEYIRNPKRDSEVFLGEKHEQELPEGHRFEGRFANWFSEQRSRFDGMIDLEKEAIVSVVAVDDKLFEKGYGTPPPKDQGGYLRGYILRDRTTGEVRALYRFAKADARETEWHGLKIDPAQLTEGQNEAEQLRLGLETTFLALAKIAMPEVKDPVRCYYPPAEAGPTETVAWLAKHGLDVVKLLYLEDLPRKAGQ